MPTPRRPRPELTGTARAVVGPVTDPKLPPDPRGLSDDEVARRVYRLAVRIASRSGRRRQYADFDDELAETWLRLWQGVRRWQPGGGADPVTFAWLGANRAWQRAAERRVMIGPKRGRGAAWTRQRLIVRDVRRDAEVGEDRNNTGVYPLSRETLPAVHPDDLAHWAKQAGRLPWKALTLTSMGGLSYRQAAAEMGCSFNRLDKLVELARRRIVHGRPVRHLAVARPHTPPAVTPALPGL